MRDLVLRKSRVLAGRLEHTAEVCKDIPPQALSAVVRGWVFILEGFAKQHGQFLKRGMIQPFLSFRKITAHPCEGWRN